MNYKAYFKKYGKVYGVSYKFNFGHWSGYIETFTNLESAEKWLETEEGDFRERELGSLKMCNARLNGDGCRW